MTIKIVTDSTCDLPQSYIDQFGITVIPLYINIGQTSYQDGIDISRETFYANLPAYESLPKTAAPGPGVFHEVYEQLIAEGATGILSIHISPSLSNTYEVAQLAAQEITAVPVKAWDSRQLSLGVGILAVTAARAASEGKSMAEIIDILEEKTTRTYTFAAVDTLEYLKQSGRMSMALASLGTLLKIKPILKMNLGVPSAERVRTTHRAVERLIELITELQPLDELYMVHTNAEAQLAVLEKKANHLFPNNNEKLSVSVTPVLGAHLGPGAYGFSCVTCKTGVCKPHSVQDELRRLARNLRG